MTDTQRALDAINDLIQWAGMRDTGRMRGAEDILRSHITQSDPQKIREAVLDQVERVLAEMESEIIPMSVERSRGWNSACIEGARRVRSLRDQEAEGDKGPIAKASMDQAFSEAFVPVEPDFVDPDGSRDTRYFQHWRGDRWVAPRYGCDSLQILFDLLAPAPYQSEKPPFPPNRELREGDQPEGDQ